MAASFLAEEGVEAANEGRFEEAARASALRRLAFLFPREPRSLVPPQPQPPFSRGEPRPAVRLDAFCRNSPSSRFEQSLGLEEDALCYCNLGVAYERLGRSAEALEAFGRAVALEPEDAVAHCSRGDALVRAGRLRDATRCYVAALSLSDGPAEPWAVVNNLGVAYEKLGEHRSAVLAFREASRLHPRYKLPKENLRRVLAAHPEALGAAVLSRDADDDRQSRRRRADDDGDDRGGGALERLWRSCTCICAPATPGKDAARSPLAVCCTTCDTISLRLSSRSSNAGSKAPAKIGI